MHLFLSTSASAPAHHHVSTIPCRGLQYIEVGVYSEEEEEEETKTKTKTKLFKNKIMTTYCTAITSEAKVGMRGCHGENYSSVVRLLVVCQFLGLAVSKFSSK